jgi:hypothetical protein
MFMRAAAKSLSRSYDRAVPWKCPACSTQIEHSAAAIQPLDGVLYRCSVCRLELVFDASINKLTVVPLHREEPNQKTRPTN